MKVTGIIAEYNPFHKGHAYHIKRTRELTGADYIIAVISGDFVQRGTPALLDKYLRCEMALSQGADLVLELPLAYAAGSAEFFAMGAVSLLDKLGIVDYLCFGSECGDIEKLSYLAGNLKEESPTFKEAIQTELKAGHPYPLARQRAIEVCRQIPGTLSSMEEMPLEEIQKLLGEPNNILALEYLKSLQRRHSRITPVTIRRESAGYHDTSTDSELASATAIRKLYQTGDLSHLADTVPNAVLDILNREYQKRFPVFADDFSMCLYYRLLMEQERNTSLHYYQDVSKELGIRIYNELSEYKSYDDFCQHVKTRQYTLTRISRSLLHIMLNLKTNDYHQYSQHDFIPYVRVLGFCKGSSSLLSAIKQSSELPIITKMADASKLLDDCGNKMLSQEVFASNLYRKIQEYKFYTTLPNEYTEQIRIF